METPPEEKKLRALPFVTHATRGLIRDRTMRRKVMFVLLAVAVLMLIAGSTLLQKMLDPRETVIWFMTYWLVCAWLTATSLLLALFDVLLVRAEERAARRALREQCPQPPSESADA
ncbi:MAG TPA: hypothetical protein VK474_02725 [Chthoniobacterales bacterium]|nr:hypothetical protein [Chthoniobacterales bacterium]